MSRVIAVFAALSLVCAWSVSAEETKDTKAKVEKKDVKKAEVKKVEAKADVKAEAKAEKKAHRLAAKVTIQPCPVCPVCPTAMPVVPVHPVTPGQHPATIPAKPAKSEPTAATKPEVKHVKAPATQPVAPATQPAVDPDDIGSIIKGIFDSAKSGKWALLVGFIVMLLTWLVNKLLKQKIPSDVLPWLSIGLGAVGTTAFALATGKHWLDAVVIGVQAGLVASGSWSAVGKYLPVIRKKPEVASAEEKPVEAKPEEPKS